MKWAAGGNATVSLTEHTSLKANWIQSMMPDVGTDVKVVLADKSGLVENLNFGLDVGNVRHHRR